MRTKLSIVDNKKFKDAEPLIKRVAVFLIVFIIYSGLIGPRIISGGIQYKDGFGFYGGLGKAVLFGVLAFILLAYRKNAVIKLRAWRKIDVLWLILSVACFSYTWVLVTNLISGNKSTLTIFLTQVLLWLSILFAMLGIFGVSNTKKLARSYKMELIYSILIAAFYYVLLTIVYAMWKYLATVVLHSVKWLLNISGLSATVLAPRTLLLDKFGISVAQYCSGIESIALFSGLYILIGILDWDRFNHKKFLYIFPFALLILFCFNILRVYVLILAGYFINPQIAFSLFHTYAGMLFFIIYSGIFWGLTYKWMLQKKY